MGSRMVFAGICVVLLASAAPASAALKYGVADDYGKYAVDGGASFFSTLSELGMVENRMTVLWRAGQVAPSVVETAFLDRSVAQAQASGIQIVFSVYPGAASEHDPAQFCAFARGLAQRYAYVREFIVGNEPNKADFWSPVDPAAYLALLAACYDQLKPLGVTVIGGATSSRKVGNGMSPVDFILGMGRAYRAGGRTTPVMDLLSHHPYPNPERIQQGAEAGYDWPNAGIPDLNRLKQAFEDAFGGSNQPTFATALKFKLDEVGWQANILPQFAALYVGAENSVTVEEAQQADYYRALIAKVSCDSHVAELLLFHLIDERELNASGTSGGWQSGMLRFDLSRRPAFDAVKAAVGAGCGGGAQTWTPATSVVGGRSTVGAVQQQVRVGGKLQQGVKFTFGAAAGEGVTWAIEIKNAAGKVVASKSGIRDAPFDAAAFVTPILVGAGTHSATLKLAATSNSARAVSASKKATSKPQPAKR